MNQFASNASSKSLCTGNFICWQTWVGLTSIWDVPLSCLGSTAAAVQPNGPNPSQPNPGPRGDGSPCTSANARIPNIQHIPALPVEKYMYFIPRCLSQGSSWPDGRVLCGNAFTFARFLTAPPLWGPRAGRLGTIIAAEQANLINIK